MSSDQAERKDKKAKEIIIKKRDYLKNWLDNAESIHKIVPYVQQAYDQAEWQGSFFESMPSEISGKIDESYNRRVDDSLQYTYTNLPQLPSMEGVHDNVTSMVAMNVSDSTAALQFAITYAVTFTSPESKSWAADKIGSYSKLQLRSENIEFIESQLANIKPENATEFKEAVEAYYASSTTGDISGLAIKMRSVTEHTKGELIEIAKKPPEQKIKWPAMAERLAKGDPSSIEYRNLLNEEGTHRALHSKLSRVSKNQIQLGQEEVKSTFAEFIAHLFTVLNLINPKHLP